MFKSVHSGYVDLPLVGEFHLEVCDKPRGRQWLDVETMGLNAGLYVGKVHLVWSPRARGLAALSFATGWCLTTPFDLLTMANGAMCYLCP